MAYPRTIVSFLEQPLHGIRIRHIGIALGGGALLVALALRWVAGSSVAIPSVTRPASRVTVEVLNASHRTGLARAATRQLRAGGIDVLSFATARDTLATTRIIVRRVEGVRSGATIVQEILGVGRIDTVVDTLRRLDLTILLGHDYPMPPLLPKG